MGPIGVQGRQGRREGGRLRYNIVLQNVTAGVDLANVQTFPVGCPQGSGARRTINRTSGTFAGEEIANRPSATPTTTSCRSTYSIETVYKTFKLQ